MNTTLTKSTLEDIVYVLHPLWPQTGDSASPKAIQSVDRQLITFALIECRLSGTIVTCEIALTNKDKDRNFTLHHGSTQISDDSGNVYPCRRTQIANQEHEIKLISGTPTKARLVFEGVMPQARKITRLEIVFSADSYDKTEFRNVLLAGGGSSSR